MHVIVALILSLIASLTAKVAAISCYSCESVYESNCAEDFEPENFFKLDCSRVAPPRFLENDLAFRNSTGCMKKIYEESGEKKIVRSCFFGDVNETEIGCKTDPTLMAIKEISCHVCDNVNYCNGAQINKQQQQQHSIYILLSIHFCFMFLVKFLLN